MPGAEKTMILRRPMMSMYFSAKSVKTKFVPETIRLTAMESLKPISSKSVADVERSDQASQCGTEQKRTAVVHELQCEMLRLKAVDKKVHYRLPC